MIIRTKAPKKRDAEQRLLCIALPINKINIHKNFKPCIWDAADADAAEKVTPLLRLHK